MIVEITTFRLLPDTDVDAFLLADKAVQAELSANHRGLIRRTSARGPEEWAVVTLWGTAADAEASDKRWGEPALDAFRSMIDADSLHVSRYEDLGG